MNKTFYWRIFKKIFPAFIVVIMAIFGITFFRKSIDNILINIEQQQASAFVLINRGQAALQLKSDFEKIGSPENSIKNSVLPVDNILEFVSSLDSLGVRYSLPHTDSFVPPTSENTVDFSVTLSANSQSLVSYLQDFEKLPYMAEVDSLSVVAQGKNWDEVNAVTIHGDLFTRPPEY
jgi:hypothetical protein